MYVNQEIIKIFQIIKSTNMSIPDPSKLEPLKPEMEEPVKDDKPVKEKPNKPDDDALVELLHVDEQFAPLLVLVS